jgi:glutamate-1-semialdehyde 2,1-aminomutase
VTREGTLVGLFLGPAAPLDYDGARRTDEAAYRALFHAQLERGVAVAPGAYEVLFPGLAHTEEVIDDILERMADAARSVASG